MENFLHAFGLDVVSCPICGGSGLIITRGEGVEIRTRECSCMDQRRSIRSLRRSGLEEILTLYTFDSYQADTASTKRIKDGALRYCESSPAWFFISGIPGSGKTHICSAICGRLIEDGLRVCYSPWTEEANKLKTMKTMSPPPREILDRLDFLKAVPVLYLDDFLRQKASAADLALAFEILNARYNRPSLRTIISSERSLSDIVGLDTAIGSRIAERAKGFTFQAPARNRRLS